jgi:hypothetical protein
VVTVEFLFEGGENDLTVGGGGSFVCQNKFLLLFEFPVCFENLFALVLFA